MTSEEISALAKTHAEAIMMNKLTKAEVVMLVACIEARIQQAIIGATLVAAPVTATKVAGTKIADKGQPCVCIMCSQHIYTLNRDLYDNTIVKDFIEAFTPMPGYKPLTRQTKISNVENNITTDCPNCNSELSLYLAGRQIG